MKTAIYLSLFLVLITHHNAGAATMAFVGEIVEVKDPEGRQARDALKIFTTRIAYYDYCSRGKFGKESIPGALATQQVLKLGSVCMIDGQLVNAATLAKALRPGLWAYVYENTWIDLRTTPDYRWGDVVAYADGQLTLREHRTHKSVHLPKNPPVENKIEVAYDGQLAPGNWVQVHEAGPTVVSGFSSESAYRPSEWLPAEEGKRGFANDLTCLAVLKSMSTKTPEAVLDISIQLKARRFLKGAWSEDEIACRKTTLVLDGKPVPPPVGFAPDRYAVLGHYRKEKSPHKIFVSSAEPIPEATAEQLKAFPADTRFQLDGLPATRDQLIGTTLRVFPGGKTRRLVVLPAS
ncbi:MAG: hypothetical protein AAF492_06070 [Verrucomicrobiota bacterium]